MTNEDRWASFLAVTENCPMTSKEMLEGRLMPAQDDSSDEGLSLGADLAQVLCEMAMLAFDSDEGIAVEMGCYPSKDLSPECGGGNVYAMSFFSNPVIAPAPISECQVKIKTAIDLLNEIDDDRAQPYAREAEDLLWQALENMDD